jgi:hypothetical protein
MPLPSNVSYGTVHGRFILAYGDTDDAGLFPDAVPASGSVFFTPSPVFLKNAGASPDPVTILPAPVEVSLDADGYIRAHSGADGLGVRLVATDDPDNNPVNWTWSVQFRLTDEDGTPVPMPGFSFSLPSNSEVDLTVLSPVPSADGTFYLVGPTGPANTLTVTSTTTGTPGTDAEVTISGTSPNQSIAFIIPRGDKGETGTAATIAVGTTTTGAPGSSATVTNSGTSGAATFNFTIPRGDKGDKGEGLTILGSVDSSDDLPATGNELNDAYITADDGHLWIWDETESWLDVGEIKGPGVAFGGNANDILVKLGSEPYETAWTNVIDGGTA